MATAFSTLNSGLRDETAMIGDVNDIGTAFSTLNSGLRDETAGALGEYIRRFCFQYPQLGPTR